MSANEQFIAGKRYLKEDNIDKALRAFEKAYREDKEDAEHMSYYGLCKALRSGEIGFGLDLCTEAIKKEFSRAEFYLNLGKIYLAAGNKKVAIKVFQKGLKYEPENEELNKYLIELGFRKRPIVPILERSNPINKYLGIIFRRLIPGLLKRTRSQA